METTTPFPSPAGDPGHKIKHTLQKELHKHPKSFEELKEEEIMEWDTSRYDFAGLIRRIFDIEELDRLHTLIPESTERGFLTVTNDQSTWFHRKFYDSPLLQEFTSLYQRFVKECIAPTLVDDLIIFQTSPTFRVHLPNNVCVGKKHRDGDYHHPSGEINYWLPFTAVFDTNGMYVESQPDKGDFHSVDMKYGQVFRFYGNKCWHYNQPNSTNRTRISVDFRIIPGSVYSQEELDSIPCSFKARLPFKVGGYYSSFHKSGAGGA
ncbi:Fe2OG dioxygenase domain-containing protein [Balamuthia mandrillaris]